MGKWIHRISNVDEVNKMADCLNCGRVKVKRIKAGWRCHTMVMKYKNGIRYSLDRPKNCEVCGSTNRISYDHDHKTGRYRGWLCNECNLALGIMKENPHNLRALADYIVRR